MTTGRIIPFDVVQKREDKRLAQRKERLDKARRRLLPLMVIVCETHQVEADDILDPMNRHKTVQLARDIIRWLGYARLHIGPTYLSQALGQAPTSTTQAIPVLRQRLADKADFRRAVECVEKLLDAAVKR